MYTKSFYRYVARSRHEALLIARERTSGRLLGACAISAEPSSLQRRLVFGTPLLLAMAARPWMLIDLLPWQALFAKAHQKPGFTPPANCPEVVTIFVDPSCRSYGTGSELLAAAEGWIRGQGYSRYFLRTVARDGNRAMGFYEKSGLVLRGEEEKLGRRFLLLEKSIGGVARPTSSESLGS
jgi:GNAT superfamily N-acetyltransferase